MATSYINRDGKKVYVNSILAKRVLRTVDAGLCGGMGEPVPGEMCVEAAVCFAMGINHSDEPPCVAEEVREVKIKLNDLDYSSRKARAKALRKLAVLQLGTADNFDVPAFKAGLEKIAAKWARRWLLGLQLTPSQFSRIEGILARNPLAANEAAAVAGTYFPSLRDDCVCCDLAYMLESAVRRIVSSKRLSRTSADKLFGRLCEDVAKLLIKMNVPGVKYLDLL